MVRRNGSRNGFSDTDALPGGSANSREYDRVYNPQGENEFTNLPENANQIEYIRLQQRMQDYAKVARSQEAQDALSRVQFWPDAGRFIIPKENTFAAHQQLVRQGESLDIQFDPKTYYYFDNVLVNHAGRRDLFDPTHPKYAHYAQARENLAILRNDIMGMYMEDGSFNPGDEKYLPMLVRIAADIGEALYAEKHPAGFLAPRLSADNINVEGEGAAYVYEFIEKNQAKDTLLGKLWASIRQFLGQAPRQYHLPPIELSAFSREKLDLPPPEDELSNCAPGELTRHCYSILRNKAEEGKLQKHQIDVLTLLEKREAIHHGHVILEWLRNIILSDKSLSEKTLVDWTNTGEPIEKVAQRRAMHDIIKSWHEIVEGLEAGSPELLQRPQIREAADTVETLEHALKLLAKLEKPTSIADTMQISSEASRQPERWNELAGQTIDRLMQTLKGGIEDAVGMLQQQEQAMEEQQQEQVEQNLAAALQHYQTRGKRKRKQAAAASGAKQKKIDRDIRADDRALGQGAFAAQGQAADAPTPPSYRQEQLKAKMAALGNRDPELIRQLGRWLYDQEAIARQSQPAAGSDGASLMPPAALQDQPFVQQVAIKPTSPKKGDGPKRPQI